MIYGFGGIPLLYMGDELGLTNDYGFEQVPEHADDNRWLHRPELPWELTRSAADSIPARVLAELRLLASVRAGLPQLHAAVGTSVKAAHNHSVVLFQRRHAAGDFLGVFSFAAEPQLVDFADLAASGITNPVDALTGERIEVVAGRVSLPAYGAWWLVNG